MQSFTALLEFSNKSKALCKVYDKHSASPLKSQLKNK